MSDYSEIQSLNQILKNHKIQISPSNVHPDFRATENIWMTFQIDQFETVLLVDDEFKDFERGIKALDLCLVLRELETYAEEEDILRWCTFKNLSVSNHEVIEYYRGLASIYQTVENILGKIDSQISDFDFELNAGAAQALRSLNSE